MRLAFGSNNCVPRQRDAAALQQLLELRLGIFAEDRGVGITQRRLEDAQHYSTSRFESVIDVDCADNGLERIGEDRGPLLTAAPQLPLAQLQLFADLQRVGAL